MNLAQLLERWQRDQAFQANVTSWTVMPSRPPRYAPFPAQLDSRLQHVLRQRGISQLYTHQAAAIEAALHGRDVTVVTPTASGKTLCYNVPVLHSILVNEASRALYLFPTKALAQDQVTELQQTIDMLDVDVKTYTYDGDTPVTARQAIRQAGHIVVTNPDMLHTGILPHHTKWVRLFENLRYIVIDELHQYRGVFGSHLANVLRRLARICAFYGSRPVFICASATIANPAELASRLTGREMTLIDDNGAPHGERHVIFYNPPVINRQLGIRRSSLLEARRLGTDLLRNRIQSIFFARTRNSVELLLSYLKESLSGGSAANQSWGGAGALPGLASRVRGYRGGYLPGERRAIERGLRSGDVLGVVSTNALELGIDIGQLQAAVLVGYPGSVASTWQQAGRAGRRHDLSLALLVATSSPLDQYIIHHPEFFFGRTPETGLINPDNLPIYVNHLKCAAFELPFDAGEPFGDGATSGEVLDYLAEQQLLRLTGGRYHWMTDQFPASEISLRAASDENFVIVDTTEPKPKVIGEMDRLAARTMLHDDAIYLHEGRQYHVDKLDWDEKKAYVRAVDVDYYTDANLAVSLQVLDILQEQELPGQRATRYLGEVLATAMATIFKKIKLHTHENLGWGKIHLPEEQMHTTAYWLALQPAALQGMAPAETEGALVGFGNLLAQIAPLFLMCDPRDIRPVVQVRAPFTERPTLYLYDVYPGGTGLADKLYASDRDIMQAALEHVTACPCDRGCPACVGPPAEVGETTKALARTILERLTADGAAKAAGQLPGA